MAMKKQANCVVATKWFKNWTSSAELRTFCYIFSPNLSSSLFNHEDFDELQICLGQPR